MVHIIVEGNIGAGKTSLVEALRDAYGSTVKVYTEPIKKFQCYHNENLLAMLYNDPKRWAFTFQKAVSMAMIKMHDDAIKAGVHTISERSIFGAKFIFIEYYKNKGYLTKAEAGLLDEEFLFLINQWQLKPSTVIYLRSTPELCYKRIQERGRAEEKKITMEYIKGLHDLHERWLNPACNFCHHDVAATKSTVVIDASQSKEAILAQVKAAEGKLFNA